MNGAETKVLWKEISGSDGRYEVSNTGLVKSWCALGSPGKRAENFRMLKPHVSNKGHLTVNVMGKQKFVHRLVMEAFVGPCPEKMETRHLNGIPTDNRLENLKYGTRSENVEDSITHGTCTGYGGVKLNEHQVRAIRKLDLRHKVLAERFGVGPSIIGYIKLRKKWSRLPD